MSTTRSTEPVNIALPRVCIRFCTECKWMLRAAYYAQELLSTFSNSLGEVALQPSTGGTFVVTISRQQSPPDPHIDRGTEVTRTIWDRIVDGGFPEAKEIKRRVRDVIQPELDLGHIDRATKTDGPSGPSTKAEDGLLSGSGNQGQEVPEVVGQSTSIGAECEDCID